MFKGNVATAGISFAMSESCFHVPIPVTSELRNTTVCFVLMTLYLQKRDERKGVNPLCGTDGDSAAGDDPGVRVAVKLSGNGRKDDQDDVD